MQLTELVTYLNHRLDLPRFSREHSNNGLQLEGRAEVNRIAVGVDASLRLFEAAAAHGADLVIVHHGISWSAEPRRFVGAVGRQMGTLFRNDISLYAAHLPLDAHAEIGNNAQLAKRCDLRDLTRCCEYDGTDIGYLGSLPAALTLRELAAIYERALPTRATVFDCGAERRVRRVAVVSGGGGMEAVQDAVARGADVLVTGEFNQMMYYPALENNLPVIALGHYASETVGVKAVLAELLEKFNLAGEFIDLPTGV